MPCTIATSVRDFENQLRPCPRRSRVFFFFWFFRFFGGGRNCHGRPRAPSVPLLPWPRGVDGLQIPPRLFGCRLHKSRTGNGFFFFYKCFTRFFCPFVFVLNEPYVKRQSEAVLAQTRCLQKYHFVPLRELGKWKIFKNTFCDWMKCHRCRFQSHQFNRPLNICKRMFRKIPVFYPRGVWWNFSQPTRFCLDFACVLLCKNSHQLYIKCWQKKIWFWFLIWGAWEFVLEGGHGTIQIFKQQFVLFQLKFWVMSFELSETKFFSRELISFYFKRASIESYKLLISIIVTLLAVNNSSKIK